MNIVDSLKPKSVPQRATYSGFYHFLGICFCLIFIVSNIAASKVTILGGIFIDTGTAYFPLLYIINDITTEVYGFRASRRVIWLAVGANICFVLLLSLVVKLPYATTETNGAFNELFSLSPRILIASVSSFLLGEYFNSVILALSKIRLQGRMFMFRAIISTVVGVTIESILFAVIAFYGRVPTEELTGMTFMLIVAKVFYELITIPITARFVKYLKKHENLDFYDKGTKFSLFSF